MKSYRIQNRATKEWRDATAPSAQEACQSIGWMIGDCYIQEKGESTKMAYTQYRVPEAARKVCKQLEYIDGLFGQGRVRHIFIVELARAGLRYLGTVGGWVGDRKDEPDKWMVKEYNLEVGIATIQFKNRTYEFYVGKPRKEATPEQRRAFTDELKRLVSDRLPVIEHDSIPAKLRPQYVGPRKQQKTARPRLSR